MPAEENTLVYESLAKLASGDSLSFTDASAVMELIMDGEVTGTQFGALMMGLHLKGETPEEIAGFATVMRDKAIRVHAGDGLLDTCGTGGDRAETFNVSTTAAFVAAAAGAKVAKHGNRAASSRCGSADLLEYLGADIQLDADRVGKVIERTGIGFMFAFLFHPAMKYAAAPRREMRIRTVFNILGPLTNPAHATQQVLGVPSAPLASKMAEVLREMGSRHALVVHGEDGLDELTLTSPSVIYELKDGNIHCYEIEPEQFGLQRAEVAALKGGDNERNAAITISILKGETGAPRDVVLLNAAAGLVAADLVDDIQQGIEAAKEAIDSGAALAKLNEFVKATHE